jgi:hypothetical protein
MCNAPSQCQLESHQGDGLNQLQEKKTHCFKIDHWSQGQHGFCNKQMEQDCKRPTRNNKIKSHLAMA